MRIALMTNNYKPVMGGVPVSIERLKRGLEDQGHQVTVFAPTYREQEQEENVFRYATCMKHFIGGIVLPNPFDLRIEKEFRRLQFDLIHVHHPMLIGRTAVYLSQKYGIPLVFTYHTRYEKYAECYTKGLLKLDSVMPLYLRTFLKHCNYIFAPTAGIRDYLEEVCKVPGQRLGILPTGIEDRNYRVTEEEKKLIRRKYLPESRKEDDIPLFLTVSRMAQEKNVSFLLESLALFKSRYGKPFRMVLVGDGPDRLRYEKLCRTLGLTEETVFTGVVPNEKTAVYFGAADLFLFASKTETQGIVIPEAFAGGTPVLAVRASGVEDLVDTGINGVLTEENREAYCSALLDFCEGRLDRVQLSENAYKTGLLYREETVAQEASRVYNEVSVQRFSKAAKYAT
ncbi:MAG: glycosyltransferase [Firmicutes bacterium]|nr:glycosyltransferase [Bacillota bacterium]